MAKSKSYGLASLQKKQNDATKLLIIGGEIERARQAKTYMAYIELAKLTGLFSGGSPLAKLLGVLFEMDHDEGRAPRTALVVHRTDGVWGEPGHGFFEMCEKHGWLPAGASDADKTKLWQSMCVEVWNG